MLKAIQLLLTKKKLMRRWPVAKKKPKPPKASVVTAIVTAIAAPDTCLTQEAVEQLCGALDDCARSILKKYGFSNSCVVVQIPDDIKGEESGA
jgi:hypothetical protein